MSEPATVDSNTLVSHQQDGRTLSGMGADVERLAETMDRHAPEPEAKPDAPVTGEATKPAEPVSRGRQRFSDLTKERDEAKAQADALKAEREALAKERDELKAKLQPAAPVAEPAKEPVKEPAAVEPTRPEPTEDEIGTKYQTYAEFARDLARWVVEQERAAYDPAAQVREILAQERAQAQFANDLRACAERARKAYPDFDKVLDSPTARMVMGRTPDEGHARVNFIIKHPQGEHIQYAILKDPALAQRIQQADDVTFGVIVAGLIPAAQPAKPAWTPPPSPHPTVGASSPTTSTPSSELAKKGYDFDSSGYREKRAAERKAKPRW